MDTINCSGYIIGTYLIEFLPLKIKPIDTIFGYRYKHVSL